MKITLDTNIFPADELIATAQGLGFEFRIATVSEREMGKPLLLTFPETAVWDESSWDGAVWADDDDVLERLIEIISCKSFPSPNKRDCLTPGQRRQLRDAMILEAHIREKRDIFVTMDKAAFLGPCGDPEKNRDALKRRFGVVIMTPDEFKSFCKNRCRAVAEA